MPKLKVSKIWIPAFLLVMAMAGCSDPDKNAGTGSPTDPLTPPTVTSVTPPDGSTLVCPNTVLITATFSKAMNPATITTTTFTLTGASAASVSGQVNYNSVDQYCHVYTLGQPCTELLFYRHHHHWGG